jgi:hypothetical protein
LNWNYVEQPGQQFLRLELTCSGELKAIVVWSIREPDRAYRYRRAFLVDVVTALSDGPQLQSVITAACGAVTEHGPDALLCHHIDHRLTYALRRCGFHVRPPERFLLVDSGSLAGASLDRLLSQGSWFVTHGDSDIDRPW